MQYDNKYDKNGRYLFAIYCFACSGHDHHNMKGNKDSKGVAIVFNKHNNNEHSVMLYDFRCTTCGYENWSNNLEYIKDYAIR